MSLNFKNYVPTILSIMSLLLYLLFLLLKLFSLDPPDNSDGDRPAADLPMGVFTVHRPLQKVTRFELVRYPFIDCCVNGYCGAAHQDL